MADNVPVGMIGRREVRIELRLLSDAARSEIYDLERWQAVYIAGIAGVMVTRMTEEAVE